MNALVVLVALLLGGPDDGTSAPAQHTALLDTVYTAEQIVVTAKRVKKDAFDIPAILSILTRQDLQARRLTRTVPEAMREIPGVMVQKTSHGQGSPFMRGFTGFRTLFLIDGIRLNNSVFRDGPNQYWNTVDHLGVDRIEIMKGASSVLYGSDAIGGMVNAITPDLYARGPSWGSRLYYRFSTAENAHVGRAELHGSLSERLGFLIGGSVKEFGDLEAGGGVGTQPKTGYGEWDADVKGELLIDEYSKLVLFHHRVAQDDVWRTHKTIYGVSWEGTTVGTEKTRALDQKRSLTYVQYYRKKYDSVLRSVRASLSYHVQEEEQYRIKSSGASDRQGFDVGTFGAWVQLESPSPVGSWIYGGEYYRDDVGSFRTTYNSDGSLDAVKIQGPVADDAAYESYAGFAQVENTILGRLDIILGARYNRGEVDARKVADPVTGDTIAVTGAWDKVVGSARFVWAVDGARHWNVFGGVAQGFRAPNLSDLTRFDTARSNEIETPAPGLGPENFLTAEIGLRTSRDGWSSEIGYFYTDIRDMIVRTPTGNVIDGSNEVTKTNAATGYVHGVELGASWRFYPRFTVFGSFAWIYGEVDTYPTSTSRLVREALDRLMPATGNLGLRWSETDEGIWVEALATIADRQDRLSTRDKSDTQRIPPGGTPGYAVFSLRGGWRLGESVTVSTLIENITDEDYRVHGSGQNEAGTNVVVGFSLGL